MDDIKWFRQQYEQAFTAQHEILIGFQKLRDSNYGRDDYTRARLAMAIAIADAEYWDDCMRAAQRPYKNIRYYCRRCKSSTCPAAEELPILMMASDNSIPIWVDEKPYI